MGKTIDEYSENFDKELDNIKKTHPKMKNSITEMNTGEGINRRLNNIVIFVVAPTLKEFNNSV